MTKWLIAAAVALTCLAGESRAENPIHPAMNKQHSLFNGQKPHWTHPLKGHPWFNKDANLTRMPTLPVYMAAPWYLYWPYDGHFQTVAPMAYGMYYPAPQNNVPPNPFQPVTQGYIPASPVPQFPSGGGSIR